MMKKIILPVSSLLSVKLSNCVQNNTKRGLYTMSDIYNFKYPKGYDLSNMKFTHAFLNTDPLFLSIENRIRKYDGNDNLIALLHSDENDNPAKVNFESTNGIDMFVSRMTWFKYGKIYRENNPADIEFYSNGSIRCKSYYNKNGNLHSCNDLPAVESYYNNKNNNIFEQRYYDDGKLKFYVLNTNIDGKSTIRFDD